LNAAQRTEGEVLSGKTRGDVGAHSFWKRGRTAIFDVQICDTDAKSYGNRTLKKVLERSTALRKKNKYEEACLKRHRDFTPMLYIPSTVWLKSMPAPLKSESLVSLRLN